MDQVQAAGAPVEVPDAGRASDIYTVARHAGVSHQTVSRVLNNSPNVRASTRQRVEESIRILGYRPNAAARALNTRRSSTMGLVVLNDELHGPASAVRQIERSAREAGYGLRVTHVSAIARSTVRDAIQALRDQMVDAVMIIDPHPADHHLLDGIDPHFPLVMIGGDLHDIPGVRYASGDGVAQAVDHLLAMGHGTVHHVAGPAGWSEAEVRREAWATRLRTRGRPVPPPLEGDWTAASGYSAGLALARQPEVTAVFAGNDRMALGVLRALAEAGRRVPEDVSVIGFDNIPDAAYYRPPLTTLSQDFASVGAHAVRLALRQAQAGHRHAAEGVVLEAPALVLRASTGPAARNG